MPYNAATRATTYLAVQALPPLSLQVDRSTTHPQETEPVYFGGSFPGMSDEEIEIQVYDFFDEMWVPLADHNGVVVYDYTAEDGNYGTAAGSLDCNWYALYTLYGDDYANTICHRLRLRAYAVDWGVVSNEITLDIYGYTRFRDFAVTPAEILPGGSFTVSGYLEQLNGLRRIGTWVGLRSSPVTIRIGVAAYEVTTGNNGYFSKSFVINTPGTYPITADYAGTTATWGVRVLALSEWWNGLTTLKKAAFILSILIPTTAGIGYAVRGRR